MRDEIDSRLWVSHHETLSRDVDRVARAIWRAVGRLRAGVPAPIKVMAVILAASVAALTAQAPSLV